MIPYFWKTKRVLTVQFKLYHPRLNQGSRIVEPQKMLIERNHEYNLGREYATT